MLHVHGSALAWPPLTLAALLHMLRRFCGATSGLNALDWVQAPTGLKFPPSARARRLIRAAQLSAW